MSRRSATSNHHLGTLAVCVSLAAATLVVFGQTIRHDFVNFGDDVYVYANPRVTSGLTLAGILWAFTQSHAANWHPLTWISHMLDYQLYGLNAGGHHLTSVLLHGATAILLFLVLRQSTGALWRSAFVAAVFAVHPLHVESVAWIAERKDALSGFFFVLTLGAYVRYARNPPSLPRYLTVALSFALGLMCKPMLVTLPLVLLLMDYWPLDRRNPRRLIAEKIPLLALSAAVSAATVLAQREAILSAGEIPVPVRIANAVVSCVTYMGQMVYPVGLAPFYPYPPNGPSAWSVLLDLVLLASISVGAFVLRRKRPYLLVGWLWYLVMLAPVIGIIQVGAQAHADRYTYLPQIGCYLIVAWTAADVAAPWRRSALVSGVLAIGVIAILIAGARVQTSYWRDSDTLWTHTLARTSRNAVAHNNPGAPLVKDDRLTEAFAHFRGALDINPNDTVAYQNLGAALMQSGHVSQAIVAFEKALEIDPNYAEAHDGLGNALLETGRVDEAIAHYTRALAIDPDQAEFHNGLGNALLRTGRVDEAIAHYNQALAIDRNHEEAHNGLGNALLYAGRVDEAIAHYQRALEIDPDHAASHNGLATALLRTGHADEALAHYNRALEIKPDFAEAHQNLGNALLETGRLAEGAAQYKMAFEDYAQTGRIDEATRAAQTLIRLAKATGQEALASQVQDELKRIDAR